MVQMLSKQRAAAEGRPFISAAGALGPLGASPPPAPRPLPAHPAHAVLATAPLQGAPTGALDAQPAQHEVAALPSARAAGGTIAQPASALPSAVAKATAAPSAGRPGGGGARDRAALPLPPSSDAAELLLDKQRAFEVFRQTVYRPPASFEENKALLRDRIAEAKAFGDEANSVRAGINAAKTRLERLRTERAMTAAGYDDTAPLEDGPEELAEVQEIDRLKAAYRDATAELRRVKDDVQGIQRLLEQNKARLQREFESWFSSLRSQASLEHLDEGTKRELYEKVTAVGTAAAAAQAASLMSRRGATAVPPVPASACKAAPMAVDSDISAYYSALGELAKRA